MCLILRIYIIQMEMFNNRKDIVYCFDKLLLLKKKQYIKTYVCKQ